MNIQQCTGITKKTPVHANPPLFARLEWKKDFPGLHIYFLNGAILCGNFDREGYFPRSLNMEDLAADDWYQTYRPGENLKRMGLSWAEVSIAYKNNQKLRFKNPSLTNSPQGETYPQLLERIHSAYIRRGAIKVADRYFVNADWEIVN